MAKLGIFFEVVRIWENTTRGDERKLKQRHQHARLCPKCREDCEADDDTSRVLDKMLTWVLNEDAGTMDEMLEALAERIGEGGIMPTVGFSISFESMRALGDQEQHLLAESNKYAPKYNEIAVGGRDWMDNFFKAEAIRGLLSALRRKEKLSYAVAEGIVTCEEAIDIWNKRREWQVHRSKCWIEDFIRESLRRVGVKELS